MSKLICNACNDAIPVESESLLCSGPCGGRYHFICGGFSDTSFRRLNQAKKSKWRCCSCLDLQIAPNLLTAPKTATVDPNIRRTVPTPSQVSSVVPIPSQVSSVDPTPSQFSSIDPEILEFFKSHYKELKELINTSVNEITTSLGYNTDLIQELKDAIKDLQTDNKNLRTKNQELAAENKQIKSELKDLNFAVIELKQYSRRTNLEISLLPEGENENIMEVLTKIENISQTKIVENITAAHRVPSYSADRAKSIVVQFKTKDFRDQQLKILKACKLKASDISPRFPDTPVYVNEHLTPELKSLFRDARKAKVDKNFKFCWVRDGKIFLRKDESSRVLRVKNHDDLLNIQSST